MTENEAIKIIEDYVEECNYTWTVDQLFAEYVKRRNKSYISYTADDVIDHCWRAFKFLEVKALNEVQEYRKLGTVEYFKELKERDTAKEIIEEYSFQVPYYKCPVCERLVSMCDDFCDNCGQRLESE